MTVHLVKYLIIKPTRCTNFSNLFLEWNSTCFGQFLCPSSGVFHCTHSNGICHTVLLTVCSQAVSKTVWHISLLCLQWKTPDGRQRNCPKHVEFHSKNKFEKLVHLVGFIIRYPRRLARQFFTSCFVLCARDDVEPWVQRCYSDQAPVHRYCCIVVLLYPIATGSNTAGSTWVSQQQLSVRW